MLLCQATWQMGVVVLVSPDFTEALWKVCRAFISVRICFQIQFVSPSFQFILRYAPPKGQDCMYLVDI